MKYVVDTHTLAWYFTKDKKLGSKAKKILQEAENGQHEILVPAIVLLEIVDIAEKKRVKLELEKLFAFIEAMPNFEVIDLNFVFIKHLVGVGKGLELHDRVIAILNELYHGVALTKDPDIEQLTRTLWD